MDELMNKMDALLQEAEEQGYCFTFSVWTGSDFNTIWSDEETFGFTIEEN